MEKLAIGLLRSSNRIQIKRAFIEKLISSESLPSPNYNLTNFISELESLWSIQNSDSSDLNKLKDRYDSFQIHYNLIQSIVNYFLTLEVKSIASDLNLNLIEHKIQNLLAHFSDLVKSVFESNSSQLTPLVKRENFLLLIVWLRLLSESLISGLRQFQLSANFINILTTMNMFLIQDATDTNSTYFLYFIQNDSYFCDEYLKFTATFLDLLDDKGDGAIRTIEVNKFILESLLESNRILIRKVIAEQQTHLPETVGEPVSFKVKLNNLCRMVKAIKLAVERSSTLHDLTVRDALSFLCFDFGSESLSSPQTKIDYKMTELFQCFNLNKSLPTLIKFFEEKQFKLSDDDDQYLLLLLLHLIDFVSWPFTNRIDEWICCIMTLLAVKLKKFTILINVCELKCDHILDLVQLKSARDSALNILSFFLINYQHSPKLFHKIFDKMCSSLKILKLKSKQNEETAGDKEVTSEDQRAYQHLGLLAFVCISKFGGFPDLYKSVLDVITDDIKLTGFDLFREKYSIEKISANIKLISSSNESSFNFKDIFSNNTSSADVTTTSSQFTSGSTFSKKIKLKKLSIGLTGLENLGNTCYLNSIIQSLFSCKLFVKSVIELEVVRSISTELSCLNQLQNVFSCMLLTKRPSIKPTALVKNCTPTWFRFGQQQDSSELLNFLLDNLNEQLKSPETNSLQTNQTNSNCVRASFGIQLQTECKCSQCNCVTTRSEECFYLPLSFSSEVGASKSDASDVEEKAAAKNSIQKMVNSFFEVEKLTSETGNSYFCSKCESLQNASKQIFFTRDESKHINPPEYLVLTLNRFIYTVTDGSVGQNTKIMDQMEYPSVIEVKTHTNRNEMVLEKYGLLAIVIHSGSSLHYGHYFTYMRNETTETSDWYLANDSHISRVSMEGLMSKSSTFKEDTPYIVFYEKIKADSEPNKMTEFAIHKNLMNLIEQDNRIYELENQEEQNKAMNPSKRDDGDDNNGANSGSGPVANNNWSTGPNLIQ